MSTNTKENDLLLNVRGHLRSATREVNQLESTIDRLTRERDEWKQAAGAEADGVTEVRARWKKAAAELRLLREESEQLRRIDQTARVVFDYLEEHGITVKTGIWREFKQALFDPASTVVCPVCSSSVQARHREGPCDRCRHLTGNEDLDEDNWLAPEPEASPTPDLYTRTPDPAPADAEPCMTCHGTQCIETTCPDCGTDPAPVCETREAVAKWLCEFKGERRWDEPDPDYRWFYRESADDLIHILRDALASTPATEPVVERLRAALAAPAPEPEGLRAAVEQWLDSIPMPAHTDPLDRACVRFEDLAELRAALASTPVTEPAAVRVAVDTVTKQWDMDQSGYPNSVIGNAAAAAVRCCARELRAALAPTLALEPVVVAVERLRAERNDWRCTALLNAELVGDLRTELTKERTALATPVSETDGLREAVERVCTILEDSPGFWRTENNRSWWVSGADLYDEAKHLRAALAPGPICAARQDTEVG